MSDTYLAIAKVALLQYALEVKNRAGRRSRWETRMMVD